MGPERPRRRPHARRAVPDAGPREPERQVRGAVPRHAATRTLDLLEGCAQERGQRERGVDGLPDVVEALREAPVGTLVVAADAPGWSPLLLGPEPTQLDPRSWTCPRPGSTTLRRAP